MATMGSRSAGTATTTAAGRTGAAASSATSAASACRLSIFTRSVRIARQPCARPAALARSASESAHSLATSSQIAPPACGFGASLSDAAGTVRAAVSAGAAISGPVSRRQSALASA